MAPKVPFDGAEDEWQRRATAAAISAAREVINKDAVNPRSVVSSLSDVELGWIVCAAIFGWISCKAQQAVAEGAGISIMATDKAVRTMTYRDPAPWEAGAVETILPALAGLDLPWDKSIGEWSKSQVVTFAWHAYKHTDGALANRDEGAIDVITLMNREQAEREVSAANGGPLMSREELAEQVPFA
jgi:hypothetical protein